MSWSMSTAVIFGCLALVGCRGNVIGVDVQTTISDAMPTVATVEWEVVTSGCTAAFVSFGTTDDLGITARA